MQQEIQAPKPQPPKKPAPLVTYDCMVNVGKNPVNHLVQKKGVTAAEIAVLRALHDNDAVSQIEEAVPDKKRPFSADTEILRLREIYGARVVKHVFGAGFKTAIPATIEDLPAEIDSFGGPRDEAEAVAA